MDRLKDPFNQISIFWIENVSSSSYSRSKGDILLGVFIEKHLCGRYFQGYLNLWFHLYGYILHAYGNTKSNGKILLQQDISTETDRERERERCMCWPGESCAMYIIQRDEWKVGQSTVCASDTTLLTCFFQRYITHLISFLKIDVSILLLEYSTTYIWAQISTLP